MSKTVIDCQILQTAAFDRGMGKFSASLLAALFEKEMHKDSKVTLLFNKNLPLTKSRKAYITNLVNDCTVQLLDLPTESVVETEQKYDAAQEVVDGYIASISDAEDDVSYIVLSPFFVDYVATLPSQPYVRNIVIVYDIIPVMIWHKQRVFPDDMYFKHFRLFVEADYIATISEAVRSDLITLVGVPEEKIITIDGGPFERPNSKAAKRKRPYILTLSAPIVHKNNKNAVLGFSEFNQRHDSKYDLVVVSSFSDEAQKELTDLADHVEFAGNISDAELAGLYEGSEGVLFASLAEGLGMPALEGVISDKPVSCSAIPVLQEISKTAFYFFDPTSPQSIADSLDELARSGLTAKIQKDYKQILKKYTWRRSASIFGKILEMPTKSLQPDDKRLSIVCSDPREGTAAAMLVEYVYMDLAQHVDVSADFIFTARTGVVPAYTPYLTDVKNTTADQTVFITKTARKPRGFVKGDIHINVSAKKSPWLRFGHTPDLELHAQKSYTSKPLGVFSWDYTLNGKKIEYAGISKLIREHVVEAT